MAINNETINKVLKQIFIEGISASEVPNLDKVTEELGIKEGFLPNDKVLSKLGWALAIFLIKGDIRRSDWVTQSLDLKEAFKKNKKKNVIPFFIGTGIGTGYDLVIFAYVKGITKDYADTVKIIRNTIRPYEITTHPMLWIHYYEPAFRP